MKFGAVPIAEAIGAISAHSLRLESGTIKKGTVLTEEHIANLAGDGVETIIVAALETDDMAEDEASQRVAKAISGENVRLDPPFTGRCNLFAEVAGVLTVNRSAVDRLNRIDPALTFATLPELSAVEAGRMVGTVKTIAFGVAETAVEMAASVAEEVGPLIGIQPYRPRSIGVVATVLPTLKESVLDKTRKVLEQRLSGTGSTVINEIRVPHEGGAVSEALMQLADEGADLFVVFGASAIADIDDVIPAAIRSAGGSVTHFGMPVDPGNLLLIGNLMDRPVLGAPGCARSPKENGFDWVLSRLLADIEVTPQDITGLGVGGLLMEIVSRPQPRRGIPRSDGKVAAIVLAAGQSRRMGGSNKLLATFDGEPLVRRSVLAALNSQAGPVIVVTGHMEQEIKDAIDGLDVLFVHNSDFSDGIAGSVRAGIDMVPEPASAAMILLGDMPGVDTATINRVIDAFSPDEQSEIVIATSSGKRGNPVLWGRRFFPDLMRISGDTGARHLIADHEAVVQRVDVGPVAALDVDTPDAVKAAGGVFEDT